MKKRSRRAKGRARKATEPTDAAALPEEISTQFAVGNVPEDGRKRRRGGLPSTYDAVKHGSEAMCSDSSLEVRTVPSVKISTTKIGSGSCKTIVNNISNSFSSSTATTAGNNSNSNSSMEEADGDTEPMHSGFMQNGPNNYRVGSTIVNLNNCTEEDVSPEFRHQDICLQVECGDNAGLMYMSKLYQGSKGKCIQVEDAWYTPNEFQAVSGRESAKDWKRSIRHQGRSLKLLLSRNVLDVHPAACRCDSCQQLQLMNGKPSPGAGEPGKTGSSDDTSTDHNNKLACNGGSALGLPPTAAPGGKKRKKGGKQLVSGPASKPTKMTGSSPASSADGLASYTHSIQQPVGINSPDKLGGQEEEEDQLPVDIPNLDSPLFKDVPSKKTTDSSSDSSSSSGGSSSSDDSSSSEDDSEEDEKKELSKVSVVPGKGSVGETEAAKPRTPIKLTISNVGKPSAKVISSASREPIDSNSSDSETDMDDTNTSTLTEEKVCPTPNTKPLADCEDVEEALRRALEEVEENNRSTAAAVDTTTTPPGTTAATSLSEETKPFKVDMDALEVATSGIGGGGGGATGLSQLHLSCSHLSHVSEDNSPPEASEEEELLKDALRVAMKSPEPIVSTVNQQFTTLTKPQDSLSWDCSDPVSMDKSTGVPNIVPAHSPTVYDTKESSATSEPPKHLEETECFQTATEQSSPPTSTASCIASSLPLPPLSSTTDVTSDEANTASPVGRSGSKYCPDGFILAPTLSKSPQHLKSTLKVSPSSVESLSQADLPDTADTADTASGGEFLVGDEKPVDKCETEQQGNSTRVVELEEDKSKLPGINGTRDTVPAEKNQSEGSNEKLDELKDQNLNIKISNCNETRVESNTETTTGTNGISPSPSAMKTEDKHETLPQKSESMSQVVTAQPVCSGSSSVHSDEHQQQPPSSPSLSSSSNVPHEENSTKPELSSPKQEDASDNNSNKSVNENSASMTTPTTTTTTTTAADTSSTTVRTTCSSGSSSSNTSSTVGLGGSSARATTPSMGSTNSATSKSSGCTHGIPDSENPFITWTKYDDDIGSTNTAGPGVLPASSLVQALARTSFPPLALPGDVSVPQISPLGGGSVVPQLSPMGLASLTSTNNQLPRLASPTATAQRLRASPSHNAGSSGSSSAQAYCHQRVSPPASRTPRSTPTPGEGNKTAQSEDTKTKGPAKSTKRTSRLSNIIDNLRTTKEKEVLGQPGSTNSESVRKNSLDTLFGAEKKSSGLPPVPSLVGKKSSHPASNSVTPPAYPSSAAFSATSSPSLQSPGGDTARAVAEKLYRDSQGFPQQISADTRHAIRSSLDAARAQAFNNTFKNSFNSFTALEDDQNKGKRMLENLEMMNGILDPYGLSAAKKASLMDIHHSSPSSFRKSDSSQSQNRIKAPSSSLPLPVPVPSVSSASSSVPNAPASSSSTSSSRPSSRQPSKQCGTSLNYPPGSLHSSSSSSRPSASSNSTSSGGSSSTTSGNNNNSSSAMFQAAPSAALAAAHMELNAVAANLFAFQHMYGMQDPYMMKTLMSNPMYLQRMMEYQKQAMDPLMLRQLEMLEAAANAEKSSKSSANAKDRDQRAAMNAQSFLWQAQAASFLQHQQMQQLQQLQLHHQQQLQHQAAAVREREARDTIAAIMAGKGGSGLGAATPTPSTNSVKSNSGSISTGQSAKSVLAAAASSSSASSASKRPRPSMSMPDAYSREGGASVEKKARSSHPGSGSASHNNLNPGSGSASHNNLNPGSSSASHNNLNPGSGSASHNNLNNYHSSSSSSSSLGLPPSSSSSKYPPSAVRSGGSSNGTLGGSSGGNNNSSKHRSSSGTSQQHHQQLVKQHEQQQQQLLQQQQQHMDLPTALQLSAAAAAGHNMWGFPGLAGQANPADLARMSRYFERPVDVPPPPASSAGSSSAGSHHAPEPEPSGAEVLDLSVKPRSGKA